MKLADLKTQALRYLALGEAEQAFLLYRAILRQVPDDLDARMKVADVLVHAGLPELARRVYAAVAFCDLQAGRPLHALVCSQALTDLGQSEAAISSLHESLATLYCATSERLGRAGPPPPGPDPDVEIGGVDLSPLPAQLAAESAAEMAADTQSFTLIPKMLRPIPLLSELSAEVLIRLMPGLLVRRLPPRTAIIQEGSPAVALFLLASGAADVLRISQGAPRTALRRLGEGELTGELALFHAGARPLRVETTEPCDVVEVPMRLLRSLAGELPALDQALLRQSADLLIRLLLYKSPLFLPLTPGQRWELSRRFVPMHLDPEEVLVHAGDLSQCLYLVASGELEVLSGDEPFAPLLGRLRGGDVHGEDSIVRGTTAPFTLRAATRTTIYCLPREVFERLCHTLPALAAHMVELSQAHEVLRALHGPGRSLLLPEEGQTALDLAHGEAGEAGDAV